MCNLEFASRMSTFRCDQKTFEAPPEPPKAATFFPHHHPQTLTMITRLPLHLKATSPPLFAPNHPTLHLLQRALYSSAATATATSPPNHQTTPAPRRPHPSKLLSPYPPDLVNPPATTRPPPLATPPPPSPSDSKARHLLNTGKAYLTFYKTGLSQILTNARLLRPNPPSPPPPEGSRARRLLVARYRHDRNLLAPFGLLLLVCGELTPFVVLLLPRMVPYTCRIPRQVAKLERGHDEGRRGEVARLAGGMTTTAGPEEMMVVARTPGWARVVGRVVPGVVRSRAMRRVREVMEDDAALRPEGAVEALVGEEVKLAAMERGLLVGGVAEDVLRARLRAWVDCSADERACFELLLRGEGELVRRGALPEAAWEV